MEVVINFNFHKKTNKFDQTPENIRTENIILGLIWAC